MKAAIAVLPGDGVGPEVTAEAERALLAVAVRWGHTFSLPHGLIGGAALDVDPLAPFPASTRALVGECDAVLLGAVGAPRWDDPSAPVRPEQGLLALRAAMGVYANLRPVQPHDSLLDAAPIKRSVLTGTNLLFVRELTGGLYFGEKRRFMSAENGESASDLCVYGTREIERVVRMAASLARMRGGKLTSVDKANVLETSRLWRRVTVRVMREEFPDVPLEHALVDSFAMQLVRAPAAYGVVVTENLFGDILTDEAAVLAGSIGVLPSASLGDPGPDGRRRGLYEPIHGSAPDIAGSGRANPAGAILSAAMLLRHSLGLEREALAVEAAVHDAISDGWRTADLCPGDERSCTTGDFGAQVEDRIRAAAR